MLSRDDCSSRQAAIGFLLSGALLGANAARAATETTLWQWYQAEFTEGRSGRTVVVEGRLVKDATLTDYGASLSIAAAQLHASGVTVAVTDGIRAAVGGQFVDDRLGTWTKHRRVRIPLTLRPVARYDNPGVPNQQRTSMWRGTSLLASVKSGLLVEVVERGAALGGGGGCLTCRNTPDRRPCRGCVQPALRGDRDSVTDR